MNAQELLDRIVALVPDFAAQWDDPGNCFREQDGSSTLHGIWAEFSHYFRERHEGLSGDQLAALGGFLSDSVASGDAGLSNAASTCFVENIAGESCGRALAPHLTGEAQADDRAWSGQA